MTPFINKKNGFTLVEIALSILVLSVGLLSIFSLFPAGLKLNKEAIDETQAALFAEEVLNGVRAQAISEPWSSIQTAIELPPVARDMWEDPDDLIIHVTSGTTGYETLRYMAKGPRPMGKGKAYLDYGIRYRLEIVNIDERRKSVILKVRPGEFGPDEPTYVFYTELYNHGLY